MFQFSPLFTSNCGIDHLTPALQLDKFLLGTHKKTLYLVCIAWDAADLGVWPV